MCGVVAKQRPCPAAPGVCCPLRAHKPTCPPARARPRRTRSSAARPSCPPAPQARPTTACRCCAPGLAPFQRELARLNLESAVHPMSVGVSASTNPEHRRLRGDGAAHLPEQPAARGRSCPLRIPDALVAAVIGAVTCEPPAQRRARRLAAAGAAGASAAPTTPRSTRRAASRRQRRRPYDDQARGGSGKQRSAPPPPPPPPRPTRRPTRRRRRRRRRPRARWATPATAHAWRPSRRAQGARRAACRRARARSDPNPPPAPPPCPSGRRATAASPAPSPPPPSPAPSPAPARSRRRRRPRRSGPGPGPEPGAVPKRNATTVAAVAAVAAVAEPPLGRTLASVIGRL